MTEIEEQTQEAEHEEAEAVGAPLPDAVPGLELEIARAREMAVPPAGALPSASEFEAAMAVARVVANTKFVPDDYRGNPDSVVAAIFTGRELGIGPMQSLRDIYMIDGRPVFSASLTLSQMRRGGLDDPGVGEHERAGLDPGAAHRHRGDRGGRVDVRRRRADRVEGEAAGRQGQLEELPGRHALGTLRREARP